jgi:hypothetical protein
LLAIYGFSFVILRKYGRLAQNKYPEYTNCKKILKKFEGDLSNYQTYAIEDEKFS